MAVQMVARIPQRLGREAKFEARRAELADATLATLGELGLARTSLREIAAHTEFSHGVLHYYFDDKFDLITYCLRRYTDTHITRYDAVLNLTQADALADGFAALLSQTMLEDTAQHKLWYDIRAESMFETALREPVHDLDDQMRDMTWRVVERYGELSGASCAFGPGSAYALVDGLFHHALLAHLRGDDDAGPRLRTETQLLLQRTMG